MPLPSLSSPWLKSRPGMSQQENGADGCLLQRRCLCIKNAVGNENIHLPFFHETARFSSAMDMMLHEQVRLLPPRPAWPGPAHGWPQQSSSLSLGQLIHELAPASRPGSNCHSDLPLFSIERRILPRPQWSLYHYLSRANSTCPSSSEFLLASKRILTITQQLPLEFRPVL